VSARTEYDKVRHLKAERAALLKRCDRIAHKAVQNAYPNARGFITRPADFNVAQDDHVRRCRHIEDVLAEIEALAIGASDACR
jgi:hypothetical protein